MRWYSKALGLAFAIGISTAVAQNLGPPSSGSSVTTVTGTSPITSSGGTTPAIGVTAASKADEQGGASGNVTTPAQQQSHPSAIKARASCSSTGTTLEAYNATCSGSAGVYTVTFTTAFTTTTYSCQITGGQNGALIGATNVKSVGNVTLTTYNLSGVATAINFDIACEGTQ